MNAGMGLYVLDGHEVVPCLDVLDWARQLENADRIVARTKVGKTVVSTVFLGMDHSFGQEGPPLLFETMVFGGEFDQRQLRTPTWADAERAHAEILKIVRGLKP